MADRRIRATFVAARTKVTPTELNYGYQHGWLTPKDVVQLAANAIVPDTEPGRIVESLSLLPSDELDKVPYLMDKLADDGKSLWVFLALAWVHDHKDEFGDPLSAVEMLYADFGYPEEMAGIVRFVPPPGGAAAGVDGIEERWQAYLEDRRNYYLGRIVLKSHASQWNGLPAAKIRLSGGRVVDVNEQYDG